MGRIVRRLMSLVLLSLLCLSGVILPGTGVAEAGAADVARATGLRFGLHPDKTRLAIDLDRRVDFRAFTLSGPDRVVIDFRGLDWQILDRGENDGAGLIARYRVGLFEPGVYRMVLDLTQPSQIDAMFVLPAQDGMPPRFVVDLSRTTPQAFAKATLKGEPEDRFDGTKVAAASPSAASQTLSAAPALPDAVKPRQRADGRRVVAIDAGHGGIDPGAIGISGVQEKSITLAFAKALAVELEKTGRYKPVLTRDRDIFIRLRDRVSIARAADAELFISIHADSVGNPRTRGLSIYTLSERASDGVAAELADSENKADLIAGVDLSTESAEVTSILIDLARRETMNLSARFAGHIIGQVQPHTELLRKPVRSAGFAVLKAPDMPSVLIETGFLSNRQDEKVLQDPSHRSRLVRGMVSAVDQFFAAEQTWSRL
ncbi:N-acetylmuramoyl-L-alanine amidase [Tistrella bauzanensis]|uniref:N-acetylmuramoyl-L-alanine amidase n=1 Tax=Tistrella bauzanensis TaxID=657419 RepID=A0ABQ1IIW0_9PROT|nr:N-acetylmuramoyl-L-alanine amidase [Tistrella bauzanensis]